MNIFFIQTAMVSTESIKTSNKLELEAEIFQISISIIIIYIIPKVIFQAAKFPLQTLPIIL